MFYFDKQNYQQKRKARSVGLLPDISILKSTQQLRNNESETCQLILQRV